MEVGRSSHLGLVLIGREPWQPQALTLPPFCRLPRQTEQLAALRPSSVTGEIASTKSENQTVLQNTTSASSFHRHPRTSIDSYAKLAQDIVRLIIYILMPDLRILPSSVLGKLGSVVEKAPFALGDKICKTAHQTGPHDTMNA